MGVRQHCVGYIQWYSTWNSVYMLIALWMWHRIRNKVLHSLLSTSCNFVGRKCEAVSSNWAYKKHTSGLSKVQFRPCTCKWDEKKSVCTCTVAITKVVSVCFFNFSVPLFLVMDTKAVFAALYSVCEENATFFSGGAKGPQGEAARRLVDVMRLIQEHARSLEPVISGFASVYHHFDFDPHIPANGYRSLVKVGLGVFPCNWSYGCVFPVEPHRACRWVKKPLCFNTVLSVFPQHNEKPPTGAWFLFVSWSLHLFF